MKIISVNPQLISVYGKVLFETECAGSMKWVYQFGNASEDSGYSFGQAQLDITHNVYAMLALKEMDCFTTDEISMLCVKDKQLDMGRMNSLLFSHRAIVDKYSNLQISDTLQKSIKYCLEIGADFVDMAGFLSVPDYDNQFNFSRGGKLYSFLRGKAASNISVSAEMIRDFKYTLSWGIKQKEKNDPEKDDVLRRYRGIVKVINSYNKS